MLGTQAALEGLLGLKPQAPATTSWWDVTIRCRDRKWRDGIKDDRPPFSFSFKVHAESAERAIALALKEFMTKGVEHKRYEVERVEREYI